MNTPADFTALRELHGRHVLTILHIKNVPANDLDDVEQEVWLKAWRHIDQLRDVGKFEQWIGRIARNCAADCHTRAARRRTISLDAVSFAVEAPAVEWDATTLREAFVRLSPADQTILTLRYVRGMEPRYIGPHLGITVNAATVRVFRANARLRQLMSID